MGLILGYFFIALVVAFGCYYKDYRECSRKSWCKDPVGFTNNFIGFHILFGVCWFPILLAVVACGPFVILGWVIQHGFGVLARWLSKKGL